MCIYRVQQKIGSPHHQLGSGNRVRGHPSYRLAYQLYPIVAIAYCLIFKNAYAQFNTGTVVAVGHGASQAVFAADSRAVIYGADGSSKIDDHYCKIATAKNQFIIAGYGTDGEQGHSLTLEGKRIAIHALKSKHGSSEEVLDRVVKGYQQSARSWLKQIGNSGIERLQQMQRGESNLFGCVFAMRLHSGLIAYQETHFFVAGIENGNYIVDSKIGRLDAPKSNVEFSAFGATDVFELFFASPKPPLIQQELVRWNAMSKTKSYTEYRTRRLVEMTIQHTSHQGTVGGHVNAVEMTGKRIRWITSNQECKKR